MPERPPRRARPLPPLLAAVGLVTGLGPPAGGQGFPLASLDGPPVTVRYAPGSLDRAAQIQARFERLIEQTGKRRWWRQPLLEVQLLEAEAWRRAGLAEPFGLPAISAEGSLALPAWGTPETVQVWLDLLDRRLPSPPGTPLRGSSEELASLTGADLIGEVEGSRVVLARLGLTGDEPWVDDLLACALTVSAQRQHEPVRRADVYHLFAALARRGESSADERLRRLRWISAAERIADQTGKLPAKPLLKLARQQPGPLPAADLLERFPWLVEWLAPRRTD